MGKTAFERHICELRDMVTFANKTRERAAREPDGIGLHPQARCSWTDLIRYCGEESSSGIQQSPHCEPHFPAM
jgi:hypothetical protein